jgi:hypothetical protein
MVPNARPRRRYCSIHNAYYPAWSDAKRTQLGTCFECADERARADAAAARRAKQAEPSAEAGQHE